MADIRDILRGFVAVVGERRAVTSAEYAILAVGVVIVVGGAIVLFDINNPMQYAGSALTAGQASLAAGAR